MGEFHWWKPAALVVVFVGIILSDCGDSLWIWQYNMEIRGCISSTYRRVFGLEQWVWLCLSAQTALAFSLKKNPSIYGIARRDTLLLKKQGIMFEKLPYNFYIYILIGYLCKIHWHRHSCLMSEATNKKREEWMWICPIKGWFCSSKNRAH